MSFAENEVRIEVAADGEGARAGAFTCPIISQK